MVYRAAQRNAAAFTRWFAVAAISVLAGCQSPNLGIDPGVQLNDAGAVPTLTPNPNGEVTGNGQVRVAMLLPKTAPGNGGTAANELRNGALLAMEDFGSGTLQLVIKDTGGQPAGAQAAASEAVREGASAIVGPLFAGNVGAASGITLPAGRTMLAFSTDTSNARRGVYLVNYTPQEDTRRIVGYALSRGVRSILAFLPNNAEGAIRESVLRTEANAGGANVQIIRYDRAIPSIEAAVQQAAALLPTSDAIYIPEGGEIPNVLLQTVRRAGTDIVGKLVMGSGSWESVAFKEPLLEGAVYPGRDVTRFGEFAARYQARFGNRPNVLAALGYDTVTLAAELVKRNGPQNAFRAETLENPSGFAGINGVFRLRSDGTAERGLAIYTVERGAGKVLAPAPGRFGRTTG